ncbi:hypothetical protein OUZ56_033092 [Daphnia magna]|uniref:Uncharacterized protein n=1 Tax=Daphnia magna TaxID=35525 RepID=A0ABR0BA62_9CRUS|nr:hypothetical protein OUZ56_033092 [Daphnia magna]
MVSFISGRALLEFPPGGPGGDHRIFANYLSRRRSHRRWSLCRTKSAFTIAKAMQGALHCGGHTRQHPEGERSIRDAASHTERATALQDRLGNGSSKCRAETTPNVIGPLRRGSVRTRFRASNVACLTAIPKKMTEPLREGELYNRLSACGIGSHLRQPPFDPAAVCEDVEAKRSCVGGKDDSVSRSPPPACDEFGNKWRRMRGDNRLPNAFPEAPSMTDDVPVFDVANFVALITQPPECNREEDRKTG